MNIAKHYSLLDAYLHEEVDEWLVVEKGACNGADFLSRVLCKLVLKDALVEIVLQLLIGHIDAKLLEAVLLAVLKAVDVEDANGRA